MSTLAAFASGFAFRCARIAVDSSLYLLIGFLTAGAARSFVGPAGLRRLFGTGRWSGPFRAWALAATILPVCSLGVLPILRELRRSGVRRDAVLTIALAGPMLNPISLAYIISYLGPGMLAILAGGSFLIATSVGIICGRPDTPEGLGPGEEDGPVTRGGPARLAAAAVHASSEASGPILRDIAAGAVVAGLAAASLSPGYLAGGAFAADPMAIPRIAAISIPSYVSPEKGMIALPEMLKFGQSAGAMFCLLVLGVGMSAGHLSWIARSYGPRLLARWFASLVAFTLAGAYAVDRLVPGVGTANADNDHFEELANPFDPSMLEHIPRHLSGYAGHVPATHWLTLAAVLALGTAGLVLRLRSVRFEDYLGPGHPPRPMAKASALDVALPRRVVAMAAMLTAAVTAMVAAYAYYPAPEEVFRDMAIIKADFFGEIGAPSRAVPLHQLDLWERQVARLPLGAAIRLAPRDEDAAPAVEELRAGIRRLREAIEGGRPDEARAIFHRLQPAYTRCRTAFEAG